MAEPVPARPQLVVEGFAQLLSAAPSPVFAAERVRARRPSLVSHLPSVAVGLQLGEPRFRGLGRLIEGERDAPTPGDPPLAEKRALQFNGVASLEVWAGTDGSLAAAAAGVGDRLSDRKAARAHGFLKLEPARLAPAEHTLLSASAGSDFRAWSQLLEYRFHYETWPEPEEGGGIIEQIDVQLSHLPDPGPEEQLVIPASTSTEGG